MEGRKAEGSERAIEDGGEEGRGKGEGPGKVRSNRGWRGGGGGQRKPRRGREGGMSYSVHFHLLC